MRGGELERQGAASTWSGWVDAVSEELRALLHAVADRVADYRSGLGDRPVRAEQSGAALLAAFDLPLPDGPLAPAQVIAELAAAAEPGLVHSAGPRFFGFVVGGTVPAALAADWLTSGWDQNAVLAAASPAAAAVEEVVRRWLLDLLLLPAHCSLGLVTGGQLANLTCLAAARHAVLDRVGWDVERDGLVGAPALRVCVGADRHASILRALRLLGIGTAAIATVPTDGQGRIRPAELAAVLAGMTGPVIVCAQAGEVNSGAVDPLGEIADLTHAVGGWLHLDGAFGLWAAASPSYRGLLAGHERADSWATDAHKWLNVPFDCGFALTAHPAAHRAAMSTTADYLPAGTDSGRDAVDWNPEMSRRARGFAVWAALRSLGRAGVADLVDRCCTWARLLAAELAALPGVEVCAEVTLNQVLLRFPVAGDPAASDARTRAVIDAVQRDGTCWLGGTTWRGRVTARVSIVNAETGRADIERSVAAIGRCAAQSHHPVCMPMHTDAY